MLLFSQAIYLQKWQLDLKYASLPIRGIAAAFQYTSINTLRAAIKN